VEAEGSAFAVRYARVGVDPDRNYQLRCHLERSERSAVVSPNFRIGGHSPASNLTLALVILNPLRRMKDLHLHFETSE
jgi:hypothetical protein